MHFRATENALVRPQDEGAIALNLQTGEYYTLNEVAARMWVLLVDGLRQDEVVQVIVTEYKVSPDNVATDLAQLIADLIQMKLLSER